MAYNNPVILYYVAYIKLGWFCFEQHANVRKISECNVANKAVIS